MGKTRSRRKKRLKVESYLFEARSSKAGNVSKMLTAGRRRKRRAGIRDAVYESVEL